MVCEFCDLGGTRMFHTSDMNRAAGIVSTKPGTLNDTTWLEPLAHIWTARAQPWVTFSLARRNTSRIRRVRLLLHRCPGRVIDRVMDRLARLGIDGL